MTYQIADSPDASSNRARSRDKSARSWLRANVQMTSYGSCQDMSTEKGLGRLKIDAHGNLVDMTALDREDLKNLELYYSTKWN